VLKKTLALIGLTVSLSANAATVSYYGYSLDTDTNIVTGGGLEWLQWDETIGMSLDDALAAYPNMRGATNAEIAALLNSFEFGMVFDDIESTSQGIPSPFDSNTESIQHHNFIELFGITCPTCPDYGSPAWAGGAEMRTLSAAYFGDEDGDGKINNVYVRDDFLIGFTQIEGYVTLYGEGWNTDTRDSEAGIALVSAVPLPAAAWLFISAIAGLAGAKRLSRSKGSA
jgi:hypothetical protein